jgi:enamine deaminase RidA (YjgF/YER057c/UK114 family)
VEVPAGARLLFVAGQVGTDRGGHTPPGAGDQAQIVWANVAAILASASMTPADVVKITTYVLDENDVPAVAEARRALLGDHAPAATLVVVRKLMRPEWRVEIDVVAASAG